MFTLKNGMEVEGLPGKIGGVAENPLQPSLRPGAIDVKLIILVNDGLRRTFFSTYQVRQVQESEPVTIERIKIPQPVARKGQRISGIGAIVGVTPFDKWGRRTFTMHSDHGRVNVIQGITEVTPRWTKVEALLAGGAFGHFVWDMRMATSSIPRRSLNAILMQRMDPTSADQRLQIVRLYLQARRYADARDELEEAMRDFPELKELEKELKTLRQLQARQVIDEIKLRRDAGQHRLAYRMLSQFPDEGVAGETLLAVRDLLKEYDDAGQRGKLVLELFDEHLGKIADKALVERIGPVRKEIFAELNVNNLDRFVDYLRLADDKKLRPEQKLSLAISGWLLGAGNGTENLAVGLSLVEVRNLVRRYLRSTDRVERGRILQEMASLEGGTPSYVAKLVAHMKPPVDTPRPEPVVETLPGAPAGKAATPKDGSKDASKDDLKVTPKDDSKERPKDPSVSPEAAEPRRVTVPGMFRISVPGLTGRSDFTYFVQLPPEYDPYRRYPAIVTLNGISSTPRQQITWWAGAYNERMQMRMGQASRHGWIIIAPVWTREHQSQYEYSPQEHAAVLYTLRDACRRYSVDTDRVFLSGHSMGGDAAWDIGLSHPDLWAGVIPIVAVADRYVSRYSDNARYVPLYFVCGEFDGDKMGRNGRDLDRYLRRPGYDAMVVEYLGRGHEHFSDEIQHLFTWMELHKRDFARREFECASMRLWDNFFWWAEVEGYPARAHVLPAQWPPTSSVRPLSIEGKILSLEDGDRITLKSGTTGVTLWLSPELVDFQRPIAVNINSRNRREPIVPSVQVLLEDVRTRGDRLHPFWAKLTVTR